ncbi:MAG TPA: nuclear transport factor 2 family protein [Gammaproteobacteria bacterium]|nr:nuclear transport factor 2 family protein [Gammaproteobacteria bacterium]
MDIDPRSFAAEWIAAWNSHDLERILGHYSDDIEITTPMIRMALGTDCDSLRGKPAVRGYWQAALDKLPNLHFELLDVAGGVDSVTVYYRSVMDKRAMEVMFFDADGRIARVVAHYT